MVNKHRYVFPTRISTTIPSLSTGEQGIYDIFYAYITNILCNLGHKNIFPRIISAFFVVETKLILFVYVANFPFRNF